MVVDFQGIYIYITYIHLYHSMPNGQSLPRQPQVSAKPARDLKDDGRVDGNFRRVDGRNPVNSPVEVGSLLPLFTKVVAPSQVVQDFFHQQYLYGWNLFVLYFWASTFQKKAQTSIKTRVIWVLGVSSKCILM